MLQELHVRNLALIEKADVYFGEGLNIMTGETGAGKSIIIGSVNLALGQKASREMIRSGAEYAYIELVFSVDERQRQALAKLEIFPDEEGILIITRKIMPARSVSRINDETATAAKLKAVTARLIDIHGQHEHQSLLHVSRHLEILDLYAKSAIDELKKEVSAEYQRYRTLKTELDESGGDQESRRREADFLRFEIEEIESADLKEGEEEELADLYRKYTHGQKIRESLSAAYEAVETETVGRALREVGEAASYDPQVGDIRDQLCDAEAILNDIRHAIGAYLDEMVFDEEDLMRTEKRLDEIRRLQSKYGATVKKVRAAFSDKKQRLEQLEHFDEYRKQCEENYQKSEKHLNDLCGRLSKERKKAAGLLAEQIENSLKDLNFLEVSFRMEVRRLDHYTANGYDEAEFLISTNPGEPEKPLGAVASGGELSRIMLAIKTVLADSDAVDTLIFDEIDSGISGRTAQKVSEKLAIISGSRQVICITHLPQIASMADCHYEIAKSADSGRTTTRIRLLDGDEVTTELARLLGGAQITDSVLQNAREMKQLADETKAAARRKN
ncbi:MAG: DNA repair protein RecN [Clostridiales bacterium]|nr:DNA repair protein RecN [Clostridiales bacterium]